MASSRRAQVLARAETVLGTISVLNGYASDVALVTREFRDISDHKAFPVLIVIDSDTSPPLLHRFENVWQDAYHFAVIGYVAASTATPRSDLLEDLWNDVVRALLANPTLAAGAPPVSLVRDLQPVHERRTDGGLWTPRGGFVQEFVAISDVNYPE